MAAGKGSALLLRLGAVVGTALVGQRSTTWNINHQDVDVTNKDSAGARTLLGAGAPRSIDVSVNGIQAPPAQKGSLFVLRVKGTGLVATVVSATDIWTTSAHGWATEQPVLLSNSGGALPTGALANTIYYARVLSSTTFTLHLTAAGAAANSGLLDVSTTGTGTHTVTPLEKCAGLRTTDYELSNAQIDVTNKDSAGWLELLADAGVQALSMSAAGVFTNAASEEIVRGYAFADTINQMALVLPNADSILAEFKVSGYGRDGNYDDAEMYNFGLQSSGALTYTAAVADTLRGYAFARSINICNLVLPNASTVQFSAYVSSYRQRGAYDGPQEYDISLLSSGVPTYA